MTAEEQQMLQGLVDRVNQTQLADKDVDAEQFIAQTLGRNPDALYVMAQTVLVQGYALEQAQKQIAELRAQANSARQEPKHTTSFLGNLLGRHEDTPHTAAPPPPPLTAGYGPGLMYPSGGYPIAGAPQQGGGFLRSAMQTATGVAAGALAFEGIESLMHGFGHGGGFGTEGGGAGFGGGRPEEIVNNYYGDAASKEHGAGAASGFLDRSGEVAGGEADSSQRSDFADAKDGAGMQDAASVQDQTDQVDQVDPAQDAEGDADALSGTDGTDYSSAGDDSMLADDVGDGDQGSDGDAGGF